MTFLRYFSLQSESYGQNGHNGSKSISPWKFIMKTNLFYQRRNYYNLNILGHQILIDDSDFCRKFSASQVGHLSFFLTFSLTVEHFLCQRSALMENVLLLNIFSASHHFTFIIFMSNIFCGA